MRDLAVHIFCTMCPLVAAAAAFDNPSNVYCFSMSCFLVIIASMTLASHSSYHPLFPIFHPAGLLRAHGVRLVSDILCLLQSWQDSKCLESRPELHHLGL